MENKKLELNEEELNKISGGTDEDGWWYGFGYPPDYPNACPKCNGGVYSIPGSEAQGGTLYICGPCGWSGRSL